MRARGAYSSIEDLKTYAQTALGTTLLPVELGERRLTPATALPESALYGPYGMGVFRNGDWIGHSGQLIGWEANVWFNLATGAVYVAMANSSDGLASADAVAQTYFPELFAGWNPSKAKLAAIPNKPSGA